jgi:hypothetical protein
MGDKMMKYHDVKNLQFRGDYMILTIDNEEKKFIIKDVSPILANSSEKEKNNYEISSSGYGIHWPSIDEDISIDGLLGIKHAREEKRKSA